VADQVDQGCLERLELPVDFRRAGIDDFQFGPLAGGYIVDHGAAEADVAGRLVGADDDQPPAVAVAGHGMRRSASRPARPSGRPSPT